MRRIHLPFGRRVGPAGLRPLLVAATVLAVGLLPTGCADGAARGPSASRSNLPALGVNVHLEGLDDDQRHALFVRLADLGATWVRVGAPWYAVQPAPGSIDPAALNRLDRILTDATALGLNVLFIGDQAPDWAGGGSATASNSTAYGSFLGALARHFRGRGPGGTSPAYELMNEPDGATPVGRPWARPDQYAAAACAGYRAVKLQDSRATVLAGALDVTDWSPWLRQALRSGLTGCFDALSAHPYSDLSVLEEIRAMVRAEGTSDPVVWVTEFGYSTCEGALTTCVSPADQASLLVTRLRRLGQNHPSVPVAMVYEAGDEPENPGKDKERGFGLFTATGASKPSVGALRDLYRDRDQR
jgi:hypothetical protein